MRKVTVLFFAFFLITIVLSPVSEAAVDEHGNVKLANDYISIFVNQDEFNQGRFAVDVTGGAPMRDNDDGKPLVYGRPKPWTSYTTVRIDGTNYVFGGPTNKRAGKNGKYGEVIQPPELKNKKIITATKFGSVVVTQILSFAHSSTTGLPDTAKITYRITNQDSKKHEVGLRVMLDTLLGENDGAPFRIKDKAVLGDALYVKKELPSFVQAFDVLNDPKVTAQATVKGPSLTTPDKVYFADWGSLADGLWDFDFNPGEDFLRKGEFELDSAMALYWDLVTLKPGETKEYVTHYGLGGITIVPGLLSLGITSPAEVVMDTPDKTAQIVAYVQNTAEIKVKDARVSLELPPTIELVSDTAVKKLGDLKPKETAQVMWEVRPKRLSNQELNYTVKVTADNTDDNQVTRGLKVVGPPKLSLELIAPSSMKKEGDHLVNDSFTVQARITNNGNSPAYGLNGYIALSPGLKVMAGDKEQKLLGALQPGESIEVPWYIVPMGIVDGSLPYSVEIRSRNAGGRLKNNTIVIPPRQPLGKIEIKDSNKKLEVGNYLSAQIKIENIPEFYQVQGNIKYNKEVLEPVYISRGNLFVKDENLLSWNTPKINYEQGVIEQIAGTLDIPENIKEGVVATIHFKIKAPGKVDLEFEEFKIDRGNSPNLFSIQLKENHEYVGGE